MRIEPFQQQHWTAQHESNIRYNLIGSGIAPLSMNELLALDGSIPENRMVSLANLPVDYSATNGAVSLREEIAGTYEACGPENILVTTGASEANFLAFNTMLSAGDHVIAPYPAYQQLLSIPRAIGCDVSLWHCRRENGFKFDLSELEGLVTSKTKLIVVNSPLNPTGTTLTNADMAGIYAMAKNVGAFLLSDEVFRWLHPASAPCEMAPAFNLGDSAISIGTMSKPFGLAGLRTGWIAAQPEFIEKCRALRYYVSFSTGSINDLLATIALKNKERIFQRSNGIITTNLALAEQWVAARANLLSFIAPSGGPVGMLHYRLDIPSIQLADRLAAEYGVLLAPGTVFGLESYLRLPLGRNPEVFRDGIEAIDKCFSDLLGRRSAGKVLQSSAHAP
jgi:aspartate/methionine/tyrosine aminotransferase